MKIIQAMKQLQSLAQKAEDLRTKISQFSADLSIETPTYQNQTQQVREWLQAHSDILKEILRLRVAIQRTNLSTAVTVELGGNQVTKTIAEWIHRRRDLARFELEAWSKLTDRGLKEQNLQTVQGGAVTEVRIRRYYDPKVKDEKIALYSTEATTIDATLEVANAITDLIE